MKKKCVSLLLTVVLLVCGVVPLAQAEGGVTTFGYNYSSCNTTFSISSTGLATMRAVATGKANFIEKMTVVVYLQKQSGNTWVKVQSTPPQWTGYTTSTKLDKTFTYQLTSRGTYRMVASFSFLGTYSGHSSESETVLKTATY